MEINMGHLNIFRMSKSESKSLKEGLRRDAVARTKIAGGRIETAERIRQAKTKTELDIEAKRLNLLKKVDETTGGKRMIIPKELRNYQQLILVIGQLNLKSTTEIEVACRKLGYSGNCDGKTIQHCLVERKKDYFSYDKQKGWLLTDKGEKEFSRLKQFI